MKAGDSRPFACDAAFDESKVKRDKEGKLSSKSSRKNQGKYDIIQDMEKENIESRFEVQRTLSAMAKQFHVSSPKDMRGEQWTLKEGSTVTGITAMATGKKIHDVTRLVNQYKKTNGDSTKAEDWVKARGTAIVTDGTTDRKAEVHWYQCRDIGKVEFKVKRWYDED
ncbi:MAG: hypothetical protein IJU05_05095 [Schwartzia sp.]|nr:hypothetical protein [Schwartzia sp. (in: firmicutes)]